jgi:hypothetical protein
MRPSKTLPRPYDLSRSQGDQWLDHSLLLLYRPAALRQRWRPLYGGDPGRSWPIRHINTLIRNATTQRRSTDDDELVQAPGYLHCAAKPPSVVFPRSRWHHNFDEEFVMAQLISSSIDAVASITSTR